MTNPFLLVVSGILILLGASSETYWLSIVIGALAVWLEPTLETVLWMSGFFLAGYFWHTGQKEFLQNEYWIPLFLVAGIILLVVVQQIFLAVILGGVLIALFLLSYPIFGGKKVYRKARENYEELKTDVGSAKGQYPKTDILEKGFKASGGKLGDFASAKKGELQSKNLPLRIAKGAKNIMDELFKLFK
ncbi:MAG: hypothetical protein V1777_01685 [Candidatus Micrarchaeota archaeon]